MADSSGIIYKIPRFCYSTYTTDCFLCGVGLGRAGHGSSGDAIQLICYKNAVYTVFVYTGVVECCTLNADVGLWVWPACVTYTGRAMVFHPFVTFGNVYCQQPSSLTCGWRINYGKG